MATDKYNQEEIKKMRFPTECESCGKVFDLNNYVTKDDFKKKISQIKQEKFNGKFRCENCQGRNQ